MKQLVPWLVCVFLAVTTVAFGVGFYAAQRNATAANSKLKARDRLAEQTAERLLPVPSLRSVQRYGAPYNVTITCTVAGSSDGPDRRAPLDLSAGPRPGDVYVKTCLAK